ncbi:hypothetical protein BsWGS_08934 [Bradybaena similaris]
MFACGGFLHTVSSARTYRVLSGVLLVRVILLCCLLAHESIRVASVSLSELFPFGTSVNDNQTACDDDGGSGEIRLTIPFPFFGRWHDKLYVNNNGVISFVAELTTYRPSKFPLTQETPIIAPYWADVNIVNSSGTVWFRETRDPAMLNKATQEIGPLFAYKNFRAKWVFVATWEEVGFYGANEEGKNKRNTFQAVLVLDVTHKQSFVILNYAKIEWTTGANSEGDTATGLGGSPAQAGFNAGDAKHYYEIEGAITPSVVNLTQTSNTGIPGKWIFRIDSPKIQDTCSQLESGSVYFQPAFASMLGGNAVSVFGLCFDTEAQSLNGRLETEDGTSEELCCFKENASAKCYLPLSFHTGMVNVSLNVDNRGWNYSGQLEIRNIVDVKTDVIRINPDQWLTGHRVNVTWNSHFFEGATSYKFDILIFKMSNGEPSLQSIYNVTHTKNDLRLYSIDLPVSFSGAVVAVVRVTAFPNNCSRNLTGPSIYSDVFPVRYADTSHSEAACTNWLSKQPEPAMNVTGHCPCTLSQAEGDTAQYIQDPLCTIDSDWPMNCKYRSKSASQCIISNQRSDASAAYVCCYDKCSRELLIALEGNGGGTMERYNFRQDGANVVPYFTYMQEEIAPYMYCCEFGKNRTQCDQYLNFRKPVDCKGYQPPSAAQAAGDPHIVTLDDLGYTFNGVGEFTLLRVKETDMEVQVRAIPATDKTNKPQNATVFSALVVKASNTSSVLEIQKKTPGEEGFVPVFLDYQPFYFTSNVTQLSEIVVYKNETQNGTVELTLVLVDVGLSILVQAMEEMLNIMVIVGSKLKGQLEGLLGNFNGDKSDDLVARSGAMLSVEASMRDIHYIFGMSWNVSRNDSLFIVDQDNNFNSGANQEPDNLTLVSSYVPVFIDEIQNTEMPNDTQDICGENQACKFDYLVTGKKTIALATLKFSERYEAVKKDVSLDVRCPYVNPSAIENGRRNLTGLQVGANLTVSCDDGFHMNGVHQLTCEPDGEWNGTPPSCIRRIPDESLPVTVAIGAAAGGFVFVLVIIIAVRGVYKKCSRRRKITTSNIGSEHERSTELPIIFPISDIPSPVFENSLFMSSLCKLSEKGSFHIPRPTFVDPNIYSEYF